MNMPLIGKLIALLFMQRSQASHQLALRGFIRNLATLVGLTVLVAMLAGALLLGLIFAGYQLLIQQGLSDYSALIVTGIILLLLTVIAALLVTHYTRQLLQLPQQLEAESPSLITQANAIVESFLAGFHNAAQQQANPTDNGQ